MSSEWASYKLGELGSVVTGKTPATGNPEFQGTDIAFVTPPDFRGDKWIVRSARTISEQGAQSVKNCIVPPKSVLVTCIGSDMGKAALSANRCVANQQINAIAVDEARFSPEFIFYNLSLRKDEIKGMAGGSAQPILNKSAFSEIRIDCPSLAMQQAIVDVLRPFDDRIALLRETNATLEAIAQALFKSWFVDFDPVHTKARGEQPQGMTEELAALFPDGFEESPLGMAPRGWSASTLGECCSYLNRGISPKYLEEGGVLVINQKCVRDFAIDLSKARRHDPSQRKIDGRELAIGDVLVNSTGVGTLGRVAQVLDLPEPAIVDSHVTVIRSGAVISWPYLGLALMRMQPAIEAMGEGTTGQTELSRGKLAELKLLVPSEAVLQAFDEVVMPLKHRISENAKQAQTLATLRDTLLPRLISGQLRLPDAEAMIEGA